MQSWAVRNLGGQKGFQNGLLLAAKHTQPGDTSAQRHLPLHYLIKLRKKSQAKKFAQKP